MKTPRKPLFAFNSQRTLYDHPINAVCALSWLDGFSRFLCLLEIAIVSCCPCFSRYGWKHGGIIFIGNASSSGGSTSYGRKQAVLSRFNGHTTFISFSPRNRPRDILSLTP
jgi:hypothetical protein